MLRKFLLFVVALAAFALSASAQTVDEIIAKHVQARGGLDKLKAVRSVRITGKMTLGGGLEAPVIFEQKRPGSLRFEITLQGLTAVQAYDGSTAWGINPFQGKKDPETLGDDDRKDLEEQSDLDGPVVDYKAKGNRVELIGKEPVEGTPAYKLKVTLKNGDVRYIYLDADSFLEIKAESKRTIRGTVRETESILGDYKEVGGLMFPFSIEAGAKGSPQKQKITIEKIELNPTIEDARFKLPETKKPDTNKPTVKPENKETETKPAKKPTEPAKPPVK